MGRTRAMNHTHKYFQLESTGLWYCANCSHYKPSNVPPPVWQPSLCWKCDGRFQLTPDNMRKPYPICDGCNSTQVSTNDAIADYIDYKTTTFDNPPMAFEEWKRVNRIEPGNE